MSFFIATDQYIHYYALNTLHIFTMDKKKSLCQTQSRRDIWRSCGRIARRSRASLAVTRVSRLVVLMKYIKWNK